MRTRASILNMAAAWGGQLTAILVQMITRIVFVRCLSAEYLGLSGLFSNILSMLSLVELGVGPAMTYSLYRPLAQRDTEKIKSLMHLYRRAYRIIGAAILLLGAAGLPLYSHFISGQPDIPHMNWIYLLFVLDSGLSYFCSYKRTLICCDQKRYIDTLVHYGFYLLYHAAQAAVLLATRNYLLFLLCQLASTLLENLTLSRIADRLYPFLRETAVQPLPKADLDQIRRSVGAMVCHKVGGIVVSGTDNLLISAFVGLAVTGLYSNYLLILNALRSILSHLFKSVTDSVGNLSAMESEEKIQEVFYKIFFLNFWLYGLCTICLNGLFQPFIALWLGEEYLLSRPVVLIVLLSFFFTGMRQTVLTFRDATGCYYHDRYKPLFESAVNLAASILLGQRFGIGGIFLGTILSTLAVCTWVEPYVLCKWVLKAPLRHYFARYFQYLAAAVLAGALTELCCRQLTGAPLLVLLGRGMLCAVVPNLVFLLLFFRTSEFQYFLALAKRLLRRRAV